MNPMQKVRLEKVTLNIGVGEAGQALENAKTLLGRISAAKPVTTHARKREPAFKVKQGDPIGVKVTLRGAAAKDIIMRGLKANDNTMNHRSFDNYGNVAFGVKEYIDFPGAKYDPKIGMLGFDVVITLTKAGKRTHLRKVKPGRTARKQRVSADEARAFMAAEFGAKVEKIVTEKV